MAGKAGLRIAYSNQKLAGYPSSQVVKSVPHLFLTEIL
jgi:hypothetical protein